MLDLNKYKNVNDFFPFVMTFVMKEWKGGGPMVATHCQSPRDEGYRQKADRTDDDKIVGAVVGAVVDAAGVAAPAD